VRDGEPGEVDGSQVTLADVDSRPNLAGVPGFARELLSDCGTVECNRTTGRMGAGATNKTFKTSVGVVP